MTALAKHEIVPIVHLRPDVAAGNRALRQRGPDVEPGEDAGGALDSPDGVPDRRAERSEELGLADRHPLLGAEHARFVLLELGRDVALGGGQRLAPLVVGGDPGGVGVGDLEVVAEDLVEPDLERGDAGAVPLALLERGDVLVAAVAERAQLVELAVVAVANDAAIGQELWRPLLEGPGELAAEIGKEIELFHRFGECGHAVEAAQRLGDVG